MSRHRSSPTKIFSGVRMTLGAWKQKKISRHAQRKGAFLLETFLLLSFPVTRKDLEMKLTVYDRD